MRGAADGDCDEAGRAVLADAITGAVVGALVGALAAADALAAVAAAVAASAYWRAAPAISASS
jgi:hypothetical protein